MICLLGDHLGSTSLTPNSTGGLLAELRYKPWGEARHTSGTTPTSVRFTGHHEEICLGGMCFYHARWYNPYLNRWIQPDSIVPEPGNPQALNRYAYSFSNPTKYTDPTGHSPLDSSQFGGCGAGNPSCWEIDSQEFANDLPGTSQQWADAATMLDGAALASDIAAEGMVITMMAIGAFGVSVEGTPVAGSAGAYAGYWMGQIAVKPALLIGNVLATAATAATVLSEAKSGSNRIRAEVQLSVSGGVQGEVEASVGPGTQISSVLTSLGWIAPLSEPSLLLQSAAVAADLGVYTTPWGAIGGKAQWP